MTVSGKFASLEDEDERISCLVEQGFTPALARSVLISRSKEFLPLTIWLVDNSSSMNNPDGKKLLSTASQHDVRVAACTRWEELIETINYHAQLSALLEAPTKFILLNAPKATTSCPQELSVAERGPEMIQEDLRTIRNNLGSVSPSGPTPLTLHLNRIYDSVQHLKERIVVVLATDGIPTDSFGYTSAQVNRGFEEALRLLQSKAWIVVRLCTNDENVLNYYQRLDDEMELSLEVLDDYLDEAKEVHSYNPWLTYSLCLHRCREMGLSCHSLHRWLDWLDERALTRAEIFEVLQILGIGASTHQSPHNLLDNDEWSNFCDQIGREQELLVSQQGELRGSTTCAFRPWNPIVKRPTMWVSTSRLKRRGLELLLPSCKRWLVALALLGAIVAMLTK
eukprot:Nitzschia sp. Nitz4//scaffold12_size214221//202391//203670//NITZ4_001539-RA/size214221-augustus-gene-0.15-mRNA-1//1//CDS//3329535137//4043//frame0